MYLAAIVLLMGVLPIVSILIEFFVPHSSHDLLFLIGKWFVFWSVGIRLMLAGVRQIANPTFTADAIFGVKEKGALTIVQELGFGNLSIGLLSVASDMSGLGSAWFVRFLNREITCCRRFGWRVYWMRSSRIVRGD